MLNKILITDPVFDKESKTYNAFDKLLLKLLIDERDIVFVHLIIRLLIFIVPFTTYFFMAETINWWIAGLYLAVNWAFFMGSFILMLHCTSHRPLFKAKFGWMKYIIPWILGPFFGESPETYFAHHMGMHHPENNLKDDLSSTMKYQRDSFFHFMLYFLRFFLLIIPELCFYFFKKNRPKLIRRTLFGELSWYALVISLAYINLPATLVVFILPLIFTRFMMMAGNWGQHAFVDAEDPGNCYRNSITCINVFYNKQCFNDGYHIIHHITPNMHYTDMPREFMANTATYAKEKAVVFEGLDFFMVWVLLMVKNYKYLAKKFVQLDDSYESQEQIISFLKTRTARI